jgi:hypothetical protein
MKEKQYVTLRYWADAGIIYRDIKLADGDAFASIRVNSIGYFINQWGVRGR